MIITMENHPLTQHPLYVRWKTLKHRGVLCAAWAESFVAFRDGLGGNAPDEGSKKLARLDNDAPMGPTNFRWTTTPTEDDQRRYIRDWHRRKPEYSKNRHFLEKYGITLADYRRMHDERDGRCDICGNRESRFIRKNHRGEVFLCVDHDHETGEVRGLLCGDCNSALGKFKDNPTTLLRAIGYLGHHKRKRLKVVE